MTELCYFGKLDELNENGELSASSVPSKGGYFYLGESLTNIKSSMWYDPSSGDIKQMIEVPGSKEDGGVPFYRREKGKRIVSQDGRIRLKLNAKSFDDSVEQDINIRPLAAVMAIYYRTGKYIDPRRIMYKDGDSRNVAWENLGLKINRDTRAEMRKAAAKRTSEKRKARVKKYKNEIKRLKSENKDLMKKYNKDMGGYLAEIRKLKQEVDQKQHDIERLTRMNYRFDKELDRITGALRDKPQPVPPPKPLTAQVIDPNIPGTTPPPPPVD